MSDMIEVTEDLQQQRAAAERERAYAEHQQLAAATLAMNASGLTVEGMRQVVAQADEMKRDASAYTAQRERERKEQEREASRVLAAQEAAEAEQRAAAFKAQKRADWVAGGMGSEREFNQQWDAIRLAIFASSGTADDEALAVERRRDEMRKKYNSGI